MLIFRAKKQKKTKHHKTPFQMKNTKKHRNEQIKLVNHSFTGYKLTRYSGFNVVSKYIRRRKIDRTINYLFPTH